MKTKPWLTLIIIFLSIIYIEKQRPQNTDIILSIIGINTAIAEENNTFYIDPEIGSMSNPGTIDRPWRTLEEVIKNNLILTKDRYGNVLNKNGKIKAGDTIILRKGYHGHVQIKNAFNDKKIVVKSDNSADARLSELEVISAKNWSFSGLKISPAFSDTGIRTNAIVILGENGYFGNSSNLELTDSYIYSFSDNAEDLSAFEWENMAKNGVVMGRNAVNLNVQNNFISKTAFGIIALSPQSIASGNVVTDFSYDGIRAIGNDNIIEYNVIKNNYIINGNHPDAIQGFNNNGVPSKHISIVGNVILNRDKKGNSYSGIMQGVSYFDGPFYDINIQDNTVMAFTWNGISLYDSVGGVIKSNVVYTPKIVEPTMSARISVNTKYKGVAMENYVAYNLANEYVWYKEGILTNIQNQDIDEQPNSSEDIFMESLNSRLNLIYTKYGKTHITAKQDRVNNDFILFGPSILAE